MTRLNAELVKSLNAPDVHSKLEDNGMTVIGGTPEQFAALMQDGIARYGLDLSVAEEAMAISDVELARRAVDPGVPRAEVVRLIGGTTPAKLARVVAVMTPVEMQMATIPMTIRGL